MEIESFSSLPQPEDSTVWELDSALRKAPQSSGLKTVKEPGNVTLMCMVLFLSFVVFVYCIGLANGRYLDVVDKKECW